MDPRYPRKPAEDYLKFSKTLQVSHGLMLLEKLKPREGDRILDLGCGPGQLSVAIAEKTGAKGKVVAVDPDKKRIALAKSTFGHVENIEFKEGSAETLPCEKFDAVFMNFVLHWIKDKKNALRNIYEVSLKSGGQLAMLFTISRPSIIEKALKELNPKENFDKITDKIYYEGLEKIERYCKEVGFVITESAELSHVLNYDLSSFLGFLSGSYNGVFDLDLIKEDKLDEFKMYLDEKGCVSVKISTGVIIVTKP